MRFTTPFSVSADSMLRRLRPVQAKVVFPDRRGLDQCFDGMAALGGSSPGYQNRDYQGWNGLRGRVLLQQQMKGQQRPFHSFLAAFVGVLHFKR
jgi:hypothetical protein